MFGVLFGTVAHVFVAWLCWIACGECYRSRNQNTIYSEKDIAYTRSGQNPYLYPDVDWTDVIFKDMAWGMLWGWW